MRRTACHLGGVAGVLKWLAEQIRSWAILRIPREECYRPLGADSFLLFFLQPRRHGEGQGASRSSAGTSPAWTSCPGSLKRKTGGVVVA